MSGPGGCLLRGGVWSQGVCLLPGGLPRPGGCLLLRGCLVPVGCLLLGGEVPGPRGCLVQGIAWSWGWGCVASQHALRQIPPPPVNRMTDSCKNIAFATSLRTVKIQTCELIISVANVEIHCFKDDRAVTQLSIFVQTD